MTRMEMAKSSVNYSPRQIDLRALDVMLTTVLRKSVCDCKAAGTSSNNHIVVAIEEVVLSQVETTERGGVGYRQYESGAQLG